MLRYTQNNFYKHQKLQILLLFFISVVQIKYSHTKIYKQDILVLDRWLSGSEYWVLSKKTWAQVPASYDGSHPTATPVLRDVRASSDLHH